MPVLKYQLSPHDGAVVDVVITPAVPALANQFQHRRNIRMLLDTGADTTAVDASVIHAWGLQYTGMVSTRTVAGKARVPTYDLRMTILNPVLNGGDVDLGALDVRAYQSGTFAGLAYRGLIGRDILNRLTVHYDGPAGAFTLEQ